MLCTWPGVLYEHILQEQRVCCSYLHRCWKASLCLDCMRRLSFAGLCSMSVGLCLMRQLRTCVHSPPAAAVAAPEPTDDPTSCLGPKSEGVRRAWIGQTRIFSFGRMFMILLTFFLQFSPVTGVRVAASPIGAAEAAHVHFHQAAQGGAAKHYGYPHTVHGAANSRAGKRSFRRACARPQSSQQGGTWYRGRWLTTSDLRAVPLRRISQASGHLRSRTTPRGSAARAVSCGASGTRLHVLTWNCGGLSTGLLDELLLYLQERAPHINIICLQETHWKHESEWLTQRWACIHSHDPKHTYAGVLTLISRQLVSSEDIRTISHLPGRMLQVRFPVAGVHADIFNCYQLPWTTRGGSKQQLLDRRARFWSTLEQAVGLTPTRNFLCVMGDFNAQLVPEAGRVGTATCVADHAEQVAQDGPVFQSLLQACDLVAVNTFLGPRRVMHTYQQNNAKTQIDYILLRSHAVDAASRTSAPVEAFPVAAHRLDCNHRPVQAHFSCHRHPWRLHSRSQPKIDVAKLRSDCARRPDVADALRAVVSSVVQASPTPEDLNAMIYRAVSAAYPVRARPMLDHHNTPALVGPIHRMWELWREARRPRASTLGDVLRKWRLMTQLRVQRRLVQRISRRSRRERVEDLLKDAAKAATAHDQAGLYKIVNRLGPKQRRARLQLRDVQGGILTKDQELRELHGHFTEVYRARPGDAVRTRAVVMPTFDVAQVERSLRLIPAGKATPSHCVPSVVWKTCYRELAPYLQDNLCKLWSTDIVQVPRLWRDAWFALLPKPSRVCKRPGDLRPIALQCSLGKASIKLLCEEVRPYVVSFLQHTPQFAYCQGRDVQMALLRAFSHFDQVRADAAAHVDTIHNRHQGRSPRKISGAITLSLDMEQAFDRLPRSLVIRALQAASVPAHLIHLVDVWHRHAYYHIAHGGLSAKVQSQQGVRQGCLLAPLLFACATGLLVRDMPEASGPAWTEILTLYADDFLAQECLSEVADVARVIQRWGMLIDFLESCGLRLSQGKSVILARVGGLKGPAAWRKFLVRKEEGWFVRVPVKHGETLIALREEHKYLGAMVSYKTYETSTFKYRLAQARTQYGRLKKLLHSRQHLTLQQRMRMYHTCVWSTLSYSLHATGLGPAQVAQLRGVVATHLRAIARSPRHLTVVKHRSPCTQDWGFLTRCKSCVMKWRLLSRGYGTARFWFRIVHADGRLLWFRRTLGSSSILISDHM